MPEHVCEVQTHLRLIEAAGEVFAEKGFRAAQVRDICRRASANVAAVNYHFGSKRGLYEAVLRHAHALINESYPFDTPPAKKTSPQRRQRGRIEGAPDSVPSVSSVVNSSPKQQLASFIETFLMRLLGGRCAWYGRLVVLEISNPVCLEMLAGEVFRPTYDRLKDILRQLIGDAPERTVDDCARSVLSQCAFYRLAEPVLQAMKLPLPSTPAGIRDLARHICEFSLGGLVRVREERRSTEEEG